MRICAFIIKLNFIYTKSFSKYLLCIFFEEILETRTLRLAETGTIVPQPLLC